MALPSTNSLLGLNLEELTDLALRFGQPAYRGQQLFDAVYRQKMERVESVSTLPLDLRARLADEGWGVGVPSTDRKFASSDGTVRYLLKLADGETVETVWMPDGDGGESGDGTEAGDEIESDELDPPRVGAAGGNSESKRVESGRAGPSRPVRRRATICVSSQVGCAVNCKFCFTALLGVKRNLEAGEIVGQIVAVLRDQGVEPPLQRVNIVFMGMGEPFLNYDNFMAAVRLLVEEVGLSPQRMTVSTSGIVPGIERFAEEPPEVRPKLAVSLNAPNDAIRSELMPINRKWSIEAVVEAVRGIRLRTRERITFEYVLLGGVTDQPQHAAEVARLVRRTGLPAKVNLIAWNPGPGIAYSMPRLEAVESFRRALEAEGVPVYLRRPRGRDIYAACGQLKRTVEG